MPYRPKIWFRNDPDWVETSAVGSIAFAVAALGVFLVSRANTDTLAGIATGVGGIVLVVGAFLAIRAFLRLL